MKDFFLAVLSVITSLCLLLIFIVIGWYIVWVAFLSRFKLMRELMSRGEEDKQTDQPNTSPDSEVKRTSKTRTRRRKVQDDDD